MGDETDVNEDFNSGSPRENPGFASYGVFSGSQHFTVAGGTFGSTTKTTNHYHTAPTVPSDYRRIPMADIDLQRQIRMDSHSGIVRLRTLHSAKIDRGKSSVTVAMYQGKGAKEEWRKDIAKYMAVRHPNVVQLCGTASSGNIHATIFHDGAIHNFLNDGTQKSNIDLIPVRQFLALHPHSHISNVYIYACVKVEFKGVQNYFSFTFQHLLSDVECTFFIRYSTGRICVDLAPGNTCVCRYSHLDQRSDQPEFKSLNTPSLEAAALSFLTLEEYHRICYWQFSQCRIASIYNPITFNLGAVISCPSGNRRGDFVETAFLPRTDSGPNRPRWDTIDWGVVMENGWTCLSTSDAVAKTTISLSVEFLDWDYWLSQANHIFKQLGISSNFEDYVPLDYVRFCLNILPTTAALPKGFLFLCPPEDFRIGPSSFKWPECPVYWSLDPFGADPLSWEDAANLGFPSLRLFTDVFGRSWDANVYTGIRQFHQGKGFDPYSQDVALHLGHLLYELSIKTHIPFAHIDDKNFRVTHNGDEPIQVSMEEESENVSESTGPNHADVSNTSPPHSGLADELPVSCTLELLIYVRLSLILGLVLSWLYVHVWSRK